MRRDALSTRLRRRSAEHSQFFMAQYKWVLVLFPIESKQNSISTLHTEEHSVGIHLLLSTRSGNQVTPLSLTRP